MERHVNVENKQREAPRGEEKNGSTGSFDIENVNPNAVTPVGGLGSRFNVLSVDDREEEGNLKAQMDTVGMNNIRFSSTGPSKESGVSKGPRKLNAEHSKLQKWEELGEQSQSSNNECYWDNYRVGNFDWEKVSNKLGAWGTSRLFSF